MYNQHDMYDAAEITTDLRAIAMTQRSSNFAAPTSSRDLRKVNQGLSALPAEMPDATLRGLFTCAHIQRDMPKPTIYLPGAARHEIGLYDI